MKDVFLLNLVELVHSQNITFDVTLTVPGGVVCGTLISTKEYFELFADAFSGAWPAGGRDELRDGFASWGEHRGDTYKSTEDGEDPFIHLKNARYVFGSVGLPTSGEGVYWRGKLAEVAGFSLGSIKFN